MSGSETTTLVTPLTVDVSSSSPSNKQTTATSQWTARTPTSRGAITPPTPPSRTDGPNSNSSSSSVMVAIRIRPLLALEAGSDRCITVLHTRSSSFSPSRSSFSSSGGGLPTSLRLGGSSGPRFTFDRIHDCDSQQEAVFGHSCLPLVESCLQGYNATVLAYGQTGSGKTFTMMGADTASAMTNHTENAGVIPRALHYLFDALEQQKNQNESMDYQVRVQFLELYGEEIHDLLRSSSRGGQSPERTAPTPTNSSSDLLSLSASSSSIPSSSSRPALSSSNSFSDRLTIRDVGQQDGEPEVVGATLKEVESAAEALACLEVGLLRRVTAATAMNESSSRSHAILSVVVEQTTTTTETNNNNGSSPSSAGEEHVQVKRSKFNFVDLAGSERVKKTHAQGKRLKEGIDINKGLLVLGNVISALGDPKKRRGGKAFVPYRDSKLTRLLKGSLGGNHKTLMIACVSPSENNMDESLNCLRYANRAKNIQNNAVVNVDANSRRIAELQGQVSALATALIHTMDGTPSDAPPPVVFTREMLEALKKGDGTVTTQPGMLSSPAKSQRGSNGVSNNNSGLDRPSPISASTPPSTKARIEDMEREINETQELLRLSQSNHDVAEEQLYVAKAEKELLQLQLSVLSDSRGGDGAWSMNDSSRSFALDDSDTASRAFVAKATEYEKEIGKLREALRQAETRLERMAWLSPNGSSGEDQASLTLKRAEDQLNLDRERMNQLKSIIEEDDHDADDEKEDNAEEELEVNELASKYLAAAEYEDQEEDEKEIHQASSADTKSDDGLQPSIEPSAANHEQAQADLMELSRNIAAKEELIDQLKLSQEKYASMRGFYEGRMKQMETALNEREAERQVLLRQLDEAKKGDSSSKELQARLKEKEKHIADLRKKHRQLVDLTAVSSRNSYEISRLQSDVKEMKRRKVDLQKELNRERKDHAVEIRRLQKEAIQKEKELTRWKNVSTKRELEARRANHIAKTRLEELGQLRTKYKDSEKQLRLLSVKRGVMAKAGLDPVIVGRRNGQRRAQLSQTSKRNLGAAKQGDTGGGEINADSLRNYFDEKVADVVRKEALADKLAQEWEEHFELTTQMDEVKQDKQEDVGDSVQSLAIQIQFKEDRIRRLAGRLGNQKSNSKENKAGFARSDSFLFDEQFAKICGEGPVSEESRDSVAKVLFGMIVRERRRVASLARTASALDERLQSAEKAASISEAALRSYMDEQSEEFVALSQTQQEHILSLMGMVKDESERVEETDDTADSTMLVLANERILVLEQELNDLRSRLDTQKSYRSKAEDLERALESKTEECREVLEELSELRATMRQVREEATNSQDEREHVATIVEIVDDALHLCGESKTAQARRQRNSIDGKQDPPRKVLPPRIKKHIELMHSSDSDQEGDDSWKAMTDDIMSDLDLIADGKVPPSLEKTKGIAAASNCEAESVFDRLADPQSFTGTQKQVLSAKADAGSAVGSSKRGQDERRAMSKEIANCLDRIVVPGENDSASNHSPKEASSGDHGKQTGGSNNKGYKSVFERLVSPSNYTGTQKEKLQGQRVKKEHRSDDSASRSLVNDVPGKDKEASGHGTDRSESGSGSLYSDYTQLDVFERLQKTTTHAFAVKHNGSANALLAETGSLTPPISPRNNESRPAVANREDPRSGPSSYANPDVFVRLAKTTTEAYAKKAHRHQRGKSSS